MFEDLNCLIYDKNLHRGLKYPWGIEVFSYKIQGRWLML
jgi:hypothetical protein